MQTSHHKPASALLLTLLIMVSVTGIVLASTKAIMNSTRQVGATSSVSQAEQIALSGIEDGLSRISQGALNATNGEYGGNATTNGQFDNSYFTLGLNRGFALGTSQSCTAWITDEDPFAQHKYDQRCPYYAMSIRRMVSLANSPGSGYTPYFAMQVRDFPIRQDVDLPVTQFSPGVVFLPAFSPTDPGGTLDCYGLKADKSVIAGVCPTGNTGLFSVTPDVPVTVRYIRLHVNNKSLVALQMTNLASTPFTVGKGYTTIDSAGYVGGIEKRLLLTISQNGTGSKSLVSTRQAFDGFGILH
jgi:hypothetical protein